MSYLIISSLGFECHHYMCQWILQINISTKFNIIKSEKLKTIPEIMYFMYLILNVPLFNYTAPCSSIKSYNYGARVGEFCIEREI